MLFYKNKPKYNNTYLNKLNHTIKQITQRLRNNQINKIQQTFP